MGSKGIAPFGRLQTHLPKPYNGSDTDCLPLKPHGVVTSICWGFLDLGRLDRVPASTFLSFHWVLALRSGSLAASSPFQSTVKHYQPPTVRKPEDLFMIPSLSSPSFQMLGALFRSPSLNLQQDLYSNHHHHHQQHQHQHHLY